MDIADDVTLREARGIYFEVNGFGPDGGYGDAWVDFKLGPVPFPFPNTPGRVAAVKFHDLHHVLTRFPTSTVGEFQISAWELGAGCAAFPTAWVINAGGLVAGMLVAPVRTARAFLRGRRDRSLYREAYDALLDLTVGEARRRFLASPSAAPRWTLRDVVAFLALLAVASVVGVVLTALFAALVPLGLVMTALRRRDEAAAQARATATRQGGA